MWGISPGGQDEAPSLYHIEVNKAPGSNFRMPNVGIPGLTARQRGATKDMLQSARSSLRLPVTGEILC